MSNWRDNILKEFIPETHKLTLVSDPDDLLMEPVLAMKLHELGCDLMEFNDSVEFRYSYELKYRSAWNQDNLKELVVVITNKNVRLNELPYDIMSTGRKLSFDLGGIFPNLSYPVVEELDRQYFDDLHEAQDKYKQGQLGDNATKDFILRHVFEISPELIKKDVALLQNLLRIHYKKEFLPDVLSVRLASILLQNPAFKDWPIEQIISDDKAFFAFLQERWPFFLESIGGNGAVHEADGSYDLKYSGPKVIPFDHQDICIYIDNLFVEGHLNPINFKIEYKDEQTWIKSGILDSGDKSSVQIDRLLGVIQNEMPDGDASYLDWLSFALKWAELSSAIHHTQQYFEPFQELFSEISTLFETWLEQKYSSLISLPPTHPVMVHHIPRFLSRQIKNQRKDKIALLVLDGLALDQWVTIRKSLESQDSSLVMRESGTFAWIPTITSVSRQAIFSGKIPFNFPKSINSTDKEPSLWKQFWEDHGYSRLEIGYKKGLGDGDAVQSIEDIFNPGKTKIIGLVIDKVDKIMHGMELGSAGMHNQINQWCSNQYFANLITYLLDHKFQIWLTSDHGNVFCKGQGKPAEGSIADTRGERVRVYPTSELRDSIAEKFEFTKNWKNHGLPNDYYPLIAQKDSAFVKKGDSLVAHGGTTIEEVIVPFIKIEKSELP